MLANLLISQLQYNSLHLASFSDFSTLPYILGPAAQLVLGSQGAVINILNFYHGFAPHTLLKSSLSFSSLQIGVLATLLTTISGVVSVDDIWGDEWDILLVSLQVGVDSEGHDFAHSVSCFCCCGLYAV